MSGTCSTYGKNEKYIKILFENFGFMRSFGRLRVD
jgi:hypothetical protein